jgi:hypothetical protein
MDEALVEDLQRLGIESFAALSAAESLTLTRGLGVTFAQARRLRFLARRAAAEGTPWPAPAPASTPAPAAPAQETPADEIPFGEIPEVEVPEVEVPEVEVAVEERPVEEAPVEEAPEVAEDSEPSTAPDLIEAPSSPAARAALPFAAAILPETPPPAEPVAAVAPGPPPAPAPEPELAAAPGPSNEAPASEEPAEEAQGVRVDPSEVKARPRFGDQFARAARERRARTEPGRTVLGWNFEIPRPEPESLPLASLSAGAPEEDREPEAVGGGAPAPDEDAGGPFAGA